MRQSRALPGRNGQQPQDTVLVIDRSGSMEMTDYQPSRMAAAKASGQEFARTRAGLCLRDRVAVVSYESAATQHCGLLQLESDLARVENAIGSIRTGDFTAIGKGLRRAAKILLPEDDSPCAKFANWLCGRESDSVRPGALQRIILLSDGHHNHGPDPLPIAKRLRKAGVLIDCIGIGGTPDEVDEDLLRRIASRTGNGKRRYRFIKNRHDLTEHYRTLATSITR